MSTDDSSDARNSKIFSSQEFMEFLAKQVDISKLEVITKSGDKISASFNGFVSASGDASVFKSLDALQSLNSIDAIKSSLQSTVSLEYTKAPPKASSSTANAFPSREWKTDYGKDHVDVTYTNCFTSSTSRKPSSSFTLPPKKQVAKGKTDWYGDYADALSPLVEAASRAQPQPVESEDEQAEPTDSRKPAPKSPPKPSKRKPRKIIPENKDYVDEYSDLDILFGRGGRSNHHPGNKTYRDMVTDRQPYYRNCDKNEKTKVAQTIVNSINREHSGRFLELEKGTNRWYVVPNIVARRKVGQALRENNTDIARAAKRQKYGPGKSPGKQQIVQAAAV
jgi:hypothetical protein